MQWWNFGPLREIILLPRFLSMFCTDVVTFSQRCFALFTWVLCRWTWTTDVSQSSGLGWGLGRLTHWHADACLRSGALGHWRLVEIPLRKSRIMLAAGSSSTCSLLLVSCVPSNVWPQIARFTARCRLMFRLRWPLQLAKLQRGLSFNVGSCDCSGWVRKGSTSSIVSWTAAWHAEHTGCTCFSRWRVTSVQIPTSQTNFSLCAKSFVVELLKKAIPSFLHSSCAN